MTRIVTCVKATKSPEGVIELVMNDQREGEPDDVQALTFFNQQELDEKMNSCENDFPLIEMACLAMMTRYHKGDPFSAWTGSRVEFDLTNGINPQIKTLQ